MGYRFSAPPNWPAPPSADWLPPEGWKPDASWPATPEGWNFWVEDPGFAGPPSTARTAAEGGVVTLAPKQNRMREQLHQLFAHELEPDEELRWYSVVFEYKAPALIVGLFSWSILLPIFGPLIALILRRPWDVGITSERVLFGHDQYGLSQKKGSSPLTAVPLRDVTVVRKGRKGGKLLVANPAHGLPARFTLVRGRNIDELEAILRR